MDLQKIYFYIEEGYGIHLGVGDKMRIYNVLREENPTNVGDISHLIFRTLVDFGYESKKLKEDHEYQKKWLKRFAEYTLKRYGMS